MTSTTLPARTASVARPRRALVRAGAVLGAVVVTSLVRVVAAASGTDFLLSDPAGSVVISLPIVARFTAIFGLLGWGSLALLERFTRRARSIWTALAVAVTVLSLVPI
ncbi:MAG: hypothetical protein QOG20_4716, partial [Pseudonocardiales bacterium]|nr:hypothetical protein [Pseudonocardiales bacterium]